MDHRAYKTLVLNSDYTVFSVVTWRTAFTKLFSENVYCVEYYDKYILDSKQRKHFLPAVLVLQEYINLSGKKSPYSKKNVFLRDNFTCQYCGYKFASSHLQIDHITPRSKEFKLPKNIKMNSYENTVTACFYCNSKKADRTPDEAGMKLIGIPKSINRSQKVLLEIQSKPIPKEWQIYLESYIKDDSQTNKETVCTSK